MTDSQSYYVPAQSRWPIIGAVALFLIATGAASTLHDLKAEGGGNGKWLLTAGLTVLLIFLIGWFRDMINESLAGKNSAQVGQSYRKGMVWFIGSEVMFFAGFFGALFYARELVVPWLAGASNNYMTHEILHPNFIPSWPLTETPDPSKYAPFHALSPWGLPFLNTILLISSSISVTWAHHGLLDGNRKKLIWGLALTVALGATFLFFQAVEYHEAYEHLGLTLHSGIFGSTFFLLTGFHGLHVTLGTIMLTTMLIRSIKGHFTVDNHFAFEATAWYWHFVDVVWIGLFIFVYIL